MLFPLIYLLVFIIFSSSLEAENQDHMSWAQQLNQTYVELVEKNKENPEYRQFLEDSKRALNQAKKCPYREFVEKVSRSAKDLSIGQLLREKGAQLPQERNLFIFVSVSMPLNALKALAREARKYGGILVLRGLSEGSFRKTAEFLKQLGEEVQIDPLKFDRYNVTHVPTFVLQGANDSYDKLAGNVSLKFALEEMSRRGDLKDLSRKQLEGSL